MSEAVKFKFCLGDKVKDRVSDITGIIDGRSQWLNGCIQYSVQPKIKKANDDRPKSYWFDEDQIDKVNSGINKTKPVKQSANGGPSSISKRNQPSK